MFNRKVRDIMTVSPRWRRTEDNLRQAAQLMVESDVGALPVVSPQDSTKVEGIITDRDICCIAAANGRDVNTTKVSEIMTRPVVSCRADDSVDACRSAMERNQIRRVPVMDERGRCVGMVALADLARKTDASPQLHHTLAAISQPRPPASVPRAA